MAFIGVVADVYQDTAEVQTMAVTNRVFLTCTQTEPATDELPEKVTYTELALSRTQALALSALLAEALAEVGLDD